MNRDSFRLAVRMIFLRNGSPKFASEILHSETDFLTRFPQLYGYSAIRQSIRRKKIAVKSNDRFGFLCPVFSYQCVNKRCSKLGGTLGQKYRRGGGRNRQSLDYILSLL